MSASPRERKEMMEKERIRGKRGIMGKETRESDKGKDTGKIRNRRQERVIEEGEGV